MSEIFIPGDHLPIFDGKQQLDLAIEAFALTGGNDSNLAHLMQAFSDFFDGVLEGNGEAPVNEDGITIVLEPHEINIVVGSVCSGLSIMKDDPLRPLDQRILSEELLMKMQATT